MGEALRYYGRERVRRRALHQEDGRARGREPRPGGVFPLPRHRRPRFFFPQGRMDKAGVCRRPGEELPSVLPLRSRRGIAERQGLRLLGLAGQGERNEGGEIAAWHLSTDDEGGRTVSQGACQAKKRGPGSVLVGGKRRGEDGVSVRVLLAWPARRPPSGIKGDLRGTAVV